MQRSFEHGGQPRHSNLERGVQPQVVSLISELKGDATLQRVSFLIVAPTVDILGSIITTLLCCSDRSFSPPRRAADEHRFRRPPPHAPRPCALSLAGLPVPRIAAGTELHGHLALTRHARTTVCCCTTAAGHAPTPYGRLPLSLPD